jgi:hypothetical protein
MTPEDTKNAEGDPVAQLARFIYEQMNVEPRRMNIAIELAKQHWDDIRRALIEQGLRGSDETEISQP